MTSRITCILILLLATGLGMTVVAQDVTNNESLIVLRGQVSCLKPERGLLPDVTVFNQTKDWGVLTDVDGTFSLEMGRYDTIIFSTALHQDYIYYLKSDSEFADHSLEITMEPDAIWLETVTIVGNQTLEEFKKEIFELGTFADDEVSITTPVISKYAKQLATGDGELVLVGPLTYLSKKFGRYHRVKKNIEDRKKSDR